MSITILDGSLGQELVHRHGAAPTPFWSTTVMQENPDLVHELHLDYLKAGAEIVTTNTYPILPDRLKGSGLEDRLDALVETAGKLAVGARDEFGAGRVMGSLGPLGASYRTDFDHTTEDARRLYAPVISALNPHVDFFAAETVSSLNQARNVVDTMGSLTDKPAWVALSVRDDDGTCLRSGELLADAKDILDQDHIEAVLINCSRPEVIEAALNVIADFGRATGAYANGFTEISDAFLEDKPTVDALTARKDLGPLDYADYAESWIAAGATLIGGCCEVGPAHIAELKRRFG